MPIYEYRCETCGSVVEKQVAVANRDNGVEECSKCGSKEIYRIASQSSFALKGKGWYKIIKEGD